MQLKVLLPTRVFLDISDVNKLVVATVEGEFGILPKRLDCVAILTPGILSYKQQSSPEQYIAIDTGLLIKTTDNVLVSTRRAIGGVPLEKLRDTVKTTYQTLDEEEQNMQTVLAKLESSFVHKFIDNKSV